MSSIDPKNENRAFLGIMLVLAMGAFELYRRLH